MNMYFRDSYHQASNNNYVEKHKCVCKHSVGMFVLYNLCTCGNGALIIENNISALPSPESILNGVEVRRNHQICINSGSKLHQYWYLITDCAACDSSDRWRQSHDYHCAVGLLQPRSKAKVWKTKIVTSIRSSALPVCNAQEWEIHL